MGCVRVLGYPDDDRPNAPKDFHAMPNKTPLAAIALSLALGLLGGAAAPGAALAAGTPDPQGPPVHAAPQRPSTGTR